ncbi:MAG: phosphoserine phosphatase [Desulfurococcales archaeon ex4484_58]|nr:MAG: phosphoserine phosphatase [Desulfurococcales archaeon ex4484_58]
MSREEKGIVWFDCDGVLTNHRSSWMYLHEYFGSKDNRFFAELYKEGYISYLDWMKIDVALMINSCGRPILKRDVEEALNRINVKREAINVIKELKERGFIVGIISSGVDLLVKRVCRIVDSDICLYNELLFINDMLIPGGKANVPLKEKPRIIREYSIKHRFTLDRVVYIGDSEWDIDVFRIVGLSIAVKPCGDACNYADYTIEELSEILPIIDKHYS